MSPTDRPAIRLGTRASTLATTQSRWVADRLAAVLDREVVLVEVTTTGDTSAQPLAQLGGTGVFVSALREALLAAASDAPSTRLKALRPSRPEGSPLPAVPSAKT